MNTNQYNVKNDNKKTIINLLRYEGPLSRKRIAEVINLTRASVTQITTVMLEDGILMELGEVTNQKKAGRKEILIDVNYNHKYLLGIDIEVDQVFVGITNLKGETIWKDAFEIDANSTDMKLYREMIEKITRMIHSFLERENISKEKILAGGIGMVGDELLTKRYKEKTYSLISFKNSIVIDLQEALNIPFSIENNVRGLALAEYEFFYSQDNTNFMFVKIMPGLGSAIMVNQNLIFGVSNLAGELGYFLVNEFYPDENQDVTLEDMLSLKFYQKELKGHINEKETPYLFKCGEFEMMHLIEAMHQEDPYVICLVKQKMKVLAYTLYNIQKILDLQKILLFFTKKQSEIYYSYLVEEAKRIDECLADNLMIGKSTNVGAHIGGAAIALRNAF